MKKNSTSDRKVSRFVSSLFIEVKKVRSQSYYFCFSFNFCIFLSGEKNKIDEYL